MTTRLRGILQPMNKIKLFLISIFFILIASTSFAALPVVLYTDIIAGPDTGGEDDDGCYLSIFGTGFGTPSEGLPPATTKVYIGGQEVEHYKYLGTCRGRSDIQQLSVLLGSNVVTGAIKVTTSEGDSNTDLSFTVSAGDIYFVDDTGNNGTGVVNDRAHPYLTMAYVYALADFGAGDFIVVRGGTYDISSAGLTLTKSGSSKTACINIMGYPGETPLMSKEASLTQT